MIRSEQLSDRAIDALLPQTQCRRCGHAGCLPYAEAISSGAADINQCPPGGDATIAAIAKLLQKDTKPLNPEYGEYHGRMLAVIDESVCIGCTLCIQACPVDAILGATKQMHTVIASECTGCELCVPPCPVDCIDMRTVANEMSTQERDRTSRRYRQRNERLARRAREKTERRKDKMRSLATKSGDDPRKAVIAAAVERVRARKQQTLGKRG